MRFCAVVYGKKTLNQAELDRAAAQAEAEIQRRMANEQCRYWVPCGRIEFFINEVGRRFKPGANRIYIAIGRGGNGVGKSTTAVNIASYLSDNHPNVYLDKADILRFFPRPSRGRIMTTPNAAKNNYDAEFSRWLRRGQYKTVKEGKHFNNKYRFQNGSEFDIMTFDQDSDQGESITLDWAIVDEPMSRRHWTALKSRFRFGGIIFFLLTPLEGAAWYHDEFETPERLSDDVVVVEIPTEANCIEHGVRGILPHQALEDQWKDMDDSEISARREGKYLEHAGRIYSNYRDDVSGHVMDRMPAYYAECWRKGAYSLYQVIDPHHRKPWAIAWWAFFPNGVDICVAEWPDTSMRPFNKIKSWTWGYDAYANLTFETEKMLGTGKPAEATIMDPNYGPSAVMSQDSVTSDGAQFYESYRRLTGGRGRQMIFPSDAVTPGHIMVKEALGDPEKGIAPMTYVMEYCRNMRYGLSHYGYSENRDEKKGLSEKPMLKDKDFADLRRYLATSLVKYEAPLAESDDNVSESLPRYANGRLKI